ncbi:MAG TPA: choice-of-anchor P family protein [Acidimicrobiales bacterium]|nr:choice-of-anchor P family protein [Acidimicrobiales bacterium]
MRTTSRGRLRPARRAALLGGVALLFMAGGSGLLAAALSDGPAGAATLGGFTVSALAEAITAQYEQPNFPLPATPSLEVDEGYASSTDNYGPTGTATASALYPGQVVANAGTELPLLVPGLPLPPAPAWPVQAVSEYPQTPNTAATDLPGLNMDTSSTTNGNSATATIGNDSATAGSNGGAITQQAPSGSGNLIAGSNALVGIGGLSATSSSQAPSTSATATATATVGGISLLGGFISIGTITSTATATSDGTTGQVTGSTQVQNISIAGEQISVGANGIQALGNKPLLALPIAALNTLLKELGISIAVTNATDKVTGPSASRTLDGLQVQINLDALDNAANKFASLLPQKLISQLPVAIPNEQLITIDLGAVHVNSTASQAYVAGNSGNTGAAATTPASSSTPSTGAATTGNTGFSPGSAGTPGSFTGNTGTTPSGSTSPSGTGSSSPLASSAPTSTVGATFKGIGAALILLGLLVAAALAYVYKRADDLTESLGSGCAEGDPLMERFAATPDELNDFGGFT